MKEKPDVFKTSELAPTLGSVTLAGMDSPAGL